MPILQLPRRAQGAVSRAAISEGSNRNPAQGRVWHAAEEQASGCKRSAMACVGLAPGHTSVCAALCCIDDLQL